MSYPAHTSRQLYAPLRRLTLPEHAAIMRGDSDHPQAAAMAQEMAEMSAPEHALLLWSNTPSWARTAIVLGGVFGAGYAVYRLSLMRV